MSSMNLRVLINAKVISKCELQLNRQTTSVLNEFKRGVSLAPSKIELELNKMFENLCMVIGIPNTAMFGSSWLDYV